MFYTLYFNVYLYVCVCVCAYVYVCIFMYMQSWVDYLHVIRYWF